MYLKLRVLVLILSIFGNGGFACERNGSDSVVNKPASQIADPNDDAERLRGWIADFRGGDLNKQTSAQEKIVEFSGRSNEFRNLAVRELLSVVTAQKDRIILCPQDCYDQWRLSVNTLGLLRASEAIEPLVDRLDVNDGTEGLSLVWYPACGALIKIGNPAVPKLETLFSPTTDEWKRFLAIHTIHKMRTPESKAALRKVLARETSRDNRAEIRRLLKLETDGY